MKQFLAKSVCVAISMSVIATVHAGDLQTQMRDLFEGSGVMSNATAPNVYQTQSSNIATLGSMQVRVPVQSTPLFNYSMPTIKAGCGGVDARLGSFSWIDDDAFKGMLEAIGNNTKGILFMLAIKGVSSLVGSNIEMLLKQLQDASNFFSNSCRNAEMLVDGALSRKSADLYSACMKIRRLAGDDEVQASARCKDRAPEENAAGANSTNPFARAAAQRDVNIIWAALKKTDLGHAERELYMNLAGTVIVRAGDNGNQVIDPTVADFRDLEQGNADLPLEAAPGDVALAGWWTCNEETDPDCLNPTQLASKSFTPFTQYVVNRMGSLRDALRNNSVPSTADVNFVNNTTLPIAQMLKLGYMSGRSQITDSFINRYAQVIGYDFAYNFLSKGLRESRNFLRNGANRRGVEEQAVNEMLDHIDKVLAHLDSAKNTAASEQQAMNSMLTNLQQIEQQMYATLPNGIQNMLTFANRLGTVVR